MTGILQAVMDSLSGVPWVRPALLAVTALATLVQAVAHQNTVANHIAGLVLSVTAVAAAGSVGQSNSGLTKNQTPPGA